MLSIKNLSKIYKGDKAAVSDLSLEIEEGDIYGFIGHFYFIRRQTVVDPSVLASRYKDNI